MQQYPAVSSAHIVSGQLYANRAEMILGLRDRLPPNPVVCEVGVALGDFSQFLLDALQPREFIAIDLFQLHEVETLWGKPTLEIFRGKTHAEFYRKRFHSSNMRIIEGDSVEGLRSLANESVDLIYLDGDHRYPGIKADTAEAATKVTGDGLLVFNDYIMYDHIQKGDYGVVATVNELVNETDWRIVSFALQHAMFCDIALQRSATAARHL